MAIIRTSPCDYGGVEVWDSAQPDSPVYLAPHLLAEYWADGALTQAGEQFVQNVIIHRLENEECPNGLYAS
jgi:hypothetical protein